MVIERTLFLALAASIAAATTVGCASANDSDAESSEAAQTAAAQGTCSSPVVEGIVRQTYVGAIGFDPVLGGPAVEEFCHRFSLPPVELSLPEDIGPVWSHLRDRCTTYAADLAPAATYLAFMEMRNILMEPRFVTPDERSQRLKRNVDRFIRDLDVCPTEEAKALCAVTPDPRCIPIASQMNAAGQRRLETCIEGGTPPYSCLEGFGHQD